MIFAIVGALSTGCFWNDLTVTSAVYGSGTNYVDVSARVSELVRQTHGFDAHPEALRADPTPGWNKTLVITYDVKGQRHVFTVLEGGRVSATILLEAARK